VTGFSCVDFSALNNRKKRLEAEGESGDTFFSLRKYALRFRPKMIVVENVSTAPWDDIQTEFRKIGYHSYFQRLDTKNFYVPHTRVRGYIICVDRHLYGLTRDSKPADGQRMLDSALRKMKEVLKALERPASSTVEAFSLAEDDPRVQSAREELSNTGRGDSARGTVVDWTRCHTRHEVERTNQCLGQMRPITQWQDGGSCKPADYMWRDWAQVQVERVLDTIDMSFLRNLNRGFDQQYKVYAAIYLLSIFYVLTLVYKSCPRLIPECRQKYRHNRGWHHRMPYTIRNPLEHYERRATGWC
jgi:site-specific DNA-cytosine methylase